MEDIQDEIIGNLKETAYKTEQYHKDIFIIFIIILIVIFYYITIICVNYYENYIKAQVVKSKCGIDICEAETFRHMLLQHNNTDDYLKYIYILLVIFILWNLFSKKNMFDFDYLIIDTDTDNDSSNIKNRYLKIIMIVFIIISIVLLIPLSVRFDLAIKNENENENEKTLEILKNESMYSNYKFYNVTATYDELVKITGDNDIVKLYSWILEHDKKRNYFKFDNDLKLPFKSLCEIKIQEKDLDSFNALKTAELEDNTIYINIDNSTEDNFIEYHNYLVTLFTYIKNNGNINITENEIRLIWNNDPSYLSSDSILKNNNEKDSDNFKKFIKIGGELRDSTIEHIEKINKEENLVVKTSGFSMQSLKNNKFLNLIREIILLIILFIIIIYICNWIINKIKYFNEHPPYKDLTIIGIDILLLIVLFANIGVKIKEYSEYQSKNQGKCK
jgi:hypothetical protein